MMPSYVQDEHGVPVEGAVIKTWEPTVHLRWQNILGKSVLQQAWRCLETGEVNWQEVPCESEE